MRRQKCIFALGATVLLGALVCGCNQPQGAGGTTVHGKLTKGGSPLTIDTAKHGDYATVTISLYSADRPHEAGFETTVAEDGTFRFEQLGIAEGNYKVAVFQGDPMSGTDELGGAFNRENTPITREITGGDVELVIDLDNP